MRNDDEKKKRVHGLDPVVRVTFVGPEGEMIGLNSGY